MKKIFKNFHLHLFPSIRLQRATRYLAVCICAGLLLLFVPSCGYSRPSETDSPRENQYPTVVLAFYTWNGRPEGTERIQELMNEQLRTKAGVEVRLMIMDSASYTQNVRLMLSSGEQIDIFNSGPIGYTACVNDEYCLDLEQDGLLKTWGSGITETVPSEYLQASRINGVLYGLPQMRDMAMSPGTYCIGQEYLDGIGFDYSSLLELPENRNAIRTDYATLESIFEKLRQKYPDRTVFAVGDNLMSQGSGVDPVGGDFFGVLMDPVNSLRIENMFTSELFLDRCEMMYRWNQKGYIAAEALTDDSSLSSRIRSGTSMVMMAQGKPGYTRQISAECGRPMVVFQTEEDIMKSSSITANLWHINRSCADPAAAMKVLNLLYTDPELASLIGWGEEGTDYIKTADGYITFPRGMTPENSQWYHTMNWLLPNQYITGVWEGDPSDLWEQTEEFNRSAARSRALGFTFDNSSYIPQYTALTNVYNENIRQLMYGFVEPEKGIAMLEQGLEEAGLMEYMAAKQQALDEWAERSGIR